MFSAFPEQVLPFDAAAAATYADVVTDRDRAGQPTDGFGARIVAICRSRQATLATRNTKDFHQAGVELRLGATGFEGQRSPVAECRTPALSGPVGAVGGACAAARLSRAAATTASDVSPNCS